MHKRSKIHLRCQWHAEVKSILKSLCCRNDATAQSATGLLPMYIPRMSSLLHMHGKLPVHVSVRSCLKLGKDRSHCNCTFGCSNELQFAGFGKKRFWTNVKVNRFSKKKKQKTNAYEVQLVGRVFYKSNRCAGCQSAGCQIDPISLILQSGGYLSCAPENLHSCLGE